MSKNEGIDFMATNSYITKITLPDSTSKLVKDIEGMHFLGTTSTNVMANEGAVTTITVGTTVYTTNPSGSQEKLRANDTVLYQELLFIFNGTKWQKLTFAASTPLVDGVQIDGASIVDNKVANIKTTGVSGGTGETTPYNANTNPLTTKAYVDAKVEELPQAMIFRGSLGTGGTITTLPTADATTVGDVYQVIEDGTYASQSAKVGDLFVCAQTPNSNPATYSWVRIPCGDEPEGTVTNVVTGAGLTGGPITSEGTIKANLASEDALKGDDVLAVGVNSSGNLAVKLGTATVSVNGVAASSGNVVTGVSASSASSTAPANAVSNMYTYDSGTETLTLNYLTAPTTTVSTATNLLQKSSS